MNPIVVVLMVALTVTGQGLGERDARTEVKAKAQAKSSSRADKLLALHTADAASYAFYRDARRTEPLELRREPIYRWTNPTRVGGQVGEVFVWTYRGRPEVIGSIFSHPADGGTRRVLCHELHSLSLAVLVVDRKPTNQWMPRAPGVELKPVAGAPVPADSAAQRLVQLRGIAREFSGRSRSDQGQTWQLRLLPRPLYRYESTDPDILDGALFALVSSAGTDPEIILTLEARKNGTDPPRWYFGAARFSDMSLWLEHKGQEVWTSIRSVLNTFNHDFNYRFRFYQDRTIPEINGDEPGSPR
jgi:hypothetical protein